MTIEPKCALMGENLKLSRDTKCSLMGENKQDVIKNIRESIMNKLPTDILEYIIKLCMPLSPCENHQEGRPSCLSTPIGSTGLNIGDMREVDFNKYRYRVEYSSISLTCKLWKFIIDSLVTQIRFSANKRISPANLNIFLSRFSNLQSLYFDRCRWLNTDHLASLDNIKTLELLSFDETRLESLSKMPTNNVKFLYTRGGAIRAGYDKFPAVEFINASSSSLLDLYTLHKCTELKILILSFTYVIDTSPLIKYNTKLEKLDLSNSYA